MDFDIFMAGTLVTLIFIAGIWISQKKSMKSYDERQKMKKNRNEYRTNEEFISFP